MQRYQVQYIKREACPACGASVDNAKPLGKIRAKNYLFKKYYVPAHPPDGSTKVILCLKCGLNYKDCVPDPEDLSSIFESVIGEAWNKNYSYKSEIDLVRYLFQDMCPSVLDVGASNGELLRSFSPHCSQVSALDVVKNSECEKHVNGEYIIGWLEDNQLNWSGDSYDIVTLFDVLEHLYDARKAFKNLASLVKQGGYVLIETGDANSILPKRFGINKWWYLNRIEHHEAFTRESVVKIASEFGFNEFFFQRKKHKYVSSFSKLRLVRTKLISLAYHVWPEGYLHLMNVLFDRPIIQPRLLSDDDHMLIILKKM